MHGLSPTHEICLKSGPFQWIGASKIDLSIEINRPKVVERQLYRLKASDKSPGNAWPGFRQAPGNRVHRHENHWKWLIRRCLSS